MSSLIVKLNDFLKEFEASTVRRALTAEMEFLANQEWTASLGVLELMAKMEQTALTGKRAIGVKMEKTVERLNFHLNSHFETI